MATLLENPLIKYQQYSVSTATAVDTAIKWESNSWSEVVNIDDSILEPLKKSIKLTSIFETQETNDWATMQQFKPYEQMFILQTFAERLTVTSCPLDTRISTLIDKHFWDLV